MSAVLKVAEVRCSFYTGGTRLIGQSPCAMVQDDDGKLAFVLPEIPPKTAQVQFVMTVKVGKGDGLFTLWSAIQPIRAGQLFLEGLRK